MKKYFFLIICFFSFGFASSQTNVKEKKTSRYELKSGILIANEVNTQKLTKIIPTLAISSENASFLLTKKRPKKPIKLSKYSKKKIDEK